MRAWTSLNWVVGVLALVVAFAYPVVTKAVLFADKRAELEGRVQSIAKAERDRYAARERYVYFPSEYENFSRAMRLLELEYPRDDIRIQAFRDDEHILVVRGIVAGDSLRDGWYPPLAYEFRIDAGGNVGDGEWLEFSRRWPGLF